MSDDALASALRAFRNSFNEEWRDHAACKGMGTGDFFLVRGQSSRKGLSVCARCPVTADCGQYAQNKLEEHGIWGGTVLTRGAESESEITISDPEVRVIPVSFSASAFNKFVECEAGYRVESFEKVQQLSGSAASLGTSCHTACEVWVKDGHYLKGYADEWSIMKGIYDEAYAAEFADHSRFDEGVKLMKSWLARQDWSNREVLSTELKKFFTIKTSAGPIPVNYIMDRIDRLNDGAIEVIDYKSLSRPVQPEDLKRKLQSRLYALAAQLEHPDAERIWVTFDMLRYDPIGIVFTKEENRATYRYILELAERIIASDGMTETINEGCRWCIRKSVCTEITRHAVAGGSVGISDPVLAANRSFKLKQAADAMKNDAAEMDAIVLRHMQDLELLEMDAEQLNVAVTIAGRRAIDPERLLHVVGADIMSRYATINVTSVDTMLKNEQLTADQKSQVRQLFRINYSEPAVKYTPKSPFA